MVLSQLVHQGAARLSGDPAVPELPAEGVTEVTAVPSVRLDISDGDVIPLLADGEGIGLPHKSLLIKLPRLFQVLDGKPGQEDIYLLVP